MAVFAGALLIITKRKQLGIPVIMASIWMPTAVLQGANLLAHGYRVFG